MTHREGRPAVRSNENVLSFVRPPIPATGAGALDLVYQAAEIFNSIENNAREIALALKPCARVPRNG